MGAEHDYSPQLEKLLQKGKGGGPKQRRIMELNPKHEILAKMTERFEKDPDDPLLDDYAQLLFGYGLIAEGGELPDPVRFNRAVADLMTRTARLLALAELVIRGQGPFLPSLYCSQSNMRGLAGSGDSMPQTKMPLRFTRLRLENWRNFRAVDVDACGAGLPGGLQRFRQIQLPRCLSLPP